MSEILKIVLTSGLTIVGGLFVLIIGQLIIKLAVEPLYQLREAIAETNFNLLFYSNIINNPEVIEETVLNEARKKFRHSAAALNSKSANIVWQKLFVRVRVMPPKEDIQKARRLLIGLSNVSARQANYKDINDDIKQIGSLLGLDGL